MCPAPKCKFSARPNTTAQWVGAVLVTDAGILADGQRKANLPMRKFPFCLSVVLSSSLLALLTSCTHHRIQAQQPTDLRLSCQELQMEMVRAEAIAREVENKTGFSGRNVGLALTFWPGIVVNEMQGSKAIDAAHARITRLNELYAKQNCTGTDNRERSSR